MYERNAPDTLLVRVEAVDDLGWSANGRVTYHLLHNDSSSSSDSQLTAVDSNSNRNRINNNNNNKYSWTNTLFQIRSDTGEIYAKKSLDGEQRDEYVLSVMAVRKKSSSLSSERVSATTRVIVRVLPRLLAAHSSSSSSSSPVFEQEVYNASVSENADFVKRPLVLHARAFDPEISNK